MEKGIVYILTNEAMPDAVKIGLTENIERRMKELYATTAIPLPFECHYAAEVENAAEVERKLHFAFGDVRINERREFFRIAPERIRAVLELLALKDMTPKEEEVVETPEERHAIEKTRNKRPPFNFKMVDIAPGSTLTFSEDPEITCRVTGNKTIEFRGEDTSLSNAAKIALHEKGYSATAYAGPDYWEYEGETLDERRKRMNND